LRRKSRGGGAEETELGRWAGEKGYFGRWKWGKKKEKNTKAVKVILKERDERANGS